MKTFKQMLTEAKLRLKDKKPMLPNKQQQAKELVLSKDKENYKYRVKRWKEIMKSEKRELKEKQNHIEWMEAQLPLAQAKAKAGHYHDAAMMLWMDSMGF